LNRFMANKPLQYLGMISYSLYLWHWPVIIFSKEIWPDFSGVYTVLTLFAISILLADITYRCIEGPFRYSSSQLYLPAKSALVASITASVLIAIVAIGYNFQVKSLPLYSDQTAAEYKPDVTPEFTSYVPKNLTPNLWNVSKSLPVIYSNGCHDHKRSQAAQGCKYGDINSKKTYVLFGDSHAAQWFPALDKYLKVQNIQLVTFTKSACPSIDVQILDQGAINTSCHEWRKRAVKKINQLNPDVIFISNFYGSKDTVLAKDQVAEWINGLKRIFKLLPEKAKIVIISDTPNFPRTPALCLSKNLLNADKCAQPKSQLLDFWLAALEEKAARDDNKIYIDMNNYLCSETNCGPIIDNLLVYRDKHHLTIELSEKLFEVLGSAIDQKLKPSSL
jgi:hypothetical protein